MIKIFVPRPEDEAKPVADPKPGADAASTRYVLPVIPEAVLERHGARVLRPSDTAVVADEPRPSPTVYRSGVLLIPGNLMEEATVRALNEILEDIGVRLEPPPPLDKNLSRREHFAAMPRAVEIAPVGTFLGEPIDAWTVLQRLRAGVRAALEPVGKPKGKKRTLTKKAKGARKHAERLESAVGAITLDHLLVGSAVDGAGGALLVGTNTATNGSPDLSDLFGRPAIGTSGRIPVTVALNDLDPPSIGENATRRPVVAVLDTGIAVDPCHRWLKPLAERAVPIDRDAVVLVDPVLQEHIAGAARSGHGIPRIPISGYADRPSIEEPLLGDLSTHAGHGTFIAGIIRQLAPGAQIYTVRVMHPDGFAHQADVVFALTSIVDDVERAHAGGKLPEDALPVDVVSLSLGYFHETDEERKVTADLEPLLRKLTDAGVTVVAAAGNFSTSREFYPAALKTVLNGPAAAPLISVGALNPNMSTARFSDEAPWVTCFASGAAIVSSLPAIQGPQQAPTRAGRRQSFDPDDFTSMFGIWSGTSFAAPVVAGCIARHLHSDAGVQDGPGNTEARARRARDAWDAVQSDPSFAVPRQAEDQ